MTRPLYSPMHAFSSSGFMPVLTSTSSPAFFEYLYAFYRYVVADENFIDIFLSYTINNS